MSTGKWFCFGLTATLSVIVAVSYVNWRHPDTPSTFNQIIEDLNRAYAAAEPGSDTALQIAAKIKKVRKQQFGDLPAADHPDAFQEGLNQLRTTPDGRTYAANYRLTALREALKAKRKRDTPLPWIERGPGNVSGRTRAIIVDPSDPDHNTWLIAATGGGIWKTTDGGNSWQEKTKDLPSLTTTTLVQCASAPSVLYAGTGRGYGSSYAHINGDGIFKSTDSGETWFQLASTAGGKLFTAINRVVVDPDNPDLVLACGNDKTGRNGQDSGPRKSGIYRSTNGGESWTLVFDPDIFFGMTTDNRVQQIVATPGNFNVLYAAVNRMGVIKSTNAGQTWSVSANNFGVPSGYSDPTSGMGNSVRVELAIAPSDTDRIYAAVERPAGVGDLYLSTNAGASWSLLENNGNTDPNWFNAFGLSGSNSNQQGWFDNTIAVATTDPNLVFVGGVNLYRITVNPDNRTRSTVPMAWWVSNGAGIPVVHGDHHSIHPILDGAPAEQMRILNTNDGGVAVSADGGNSWRQMTNLVTTQFYSADKKPGASAYIGGMQDNGTYMSAENPTGATPWQRAGFGDGFAVAWHYKDPNKLISTVQFGAYNRSLDGGQSWQVLSDALAGVGPFYTKLGYSKTDPDLIFTIGSGGIKRSDDFGSTWTRKSVPSWAGFNTFDSVAVSIADPRVVWISSRREGRPKGGVHVSADSGLNFTQISDNLPTDLTYAAGIGTHPTDPATAWLVFGNPNSPKILQTNDMGQSWSDISGFTGASRGFPDVTAFSIIAMPYNPDILWVGTEIGLVVSEDGGQSWEISDSGLPHATIMQLSITDDEVVVATYGRGVWSVTLPELAGYQPPKVTLVPRVGQIGLRPNGNFTVPIDLRSAYDQAVITISGEAYQELPANDIPLSRLYSLPAGTPGIRFISVVASKDGEDFTSSTKRVQSFGLPASENYLNDFNDPGAADDYFGSGFSIDSRTGFSDNAIHSFHPYATTGESIYMLKVPINLQAQSMTLAYDDVVLVEPGTPGSSYGELQFWDYVVVEGTRDGITWIPLAPGYDSGSSPTWLNAYNSGGNGNSSMFEHHEIDLLATFDPGEQIFIRFRMFSDSNVTGWGWAIDNLAISGSGGFQQPQRKLVFPWVSNNQQFDSILVVNNPGDRIAEMRLTARRDSGPEFTSDLLLVPPKGFLRRRPAELFPEMGDGKGFTVVLESATAGLDARWVTNNLAAASGQSPSQGVAVPLPDAIANQRIGHDILFGYLPITGGLISAPVVVNLGDSPADVTLNFFNQAGNLLKQEIVNLEPNRPLAQTANQFLPGVSEDVHMTAHCAEQLISGVVFVFNEENETAIGNVTGFDPESEDPPSDLLFAWISSNADFESLVVVNNIGETEATLSLTAARSSGPEEVVARSVPPRGFLLESAADLFPDLGSGSGYAVRVSSDSPHVHGRWVTNNLAAASGRSPSQGVAVSALESSSNPRLGQNINFGFLPVTEGLISAPVVVNAGETTTDVTLYIFNQAGALLHQETLLDMPPNRPFATVVNGLVADLSEDVAMVAVSSHGPITGVAFVFNQGNEPAIGNVTAVTFSPP